MNLNVAIIIIKIMKITKTILLFLDGGRTQLGGIKLVIKLMIMSDARIH